MCRRSGNTTAVHALAAHRPRKPPKERAAGRVYLQKLAIAGACRLILGCMSKMSANMPPREYGSCLAEQAASARCARVPQQGVLMWWSEPSATIGTAGRATHQEVAREWHERTRVENYAKPRREARDAGKAADRCHLRCPGRDSAIVLLSSSPSQPSSMEEPWKRFHFQRWETRDGFLASNMVTGAWTRKNPNILAARLGHGFARKGPSVTEPKEPQPHGAARHEPSVTDAHRRLCHPRNATRPATRTREKHLQASRSVAVGLGARTTTCKLRPNQTHR